MEKACTFIGHKDCSSSIYDELYKVIEKLITDSGVSKFYVGTHGNFDKIVYKALTQLENKYNINIIVVLAFLNTKSENIYYELKKTVFPDILEKVPLRFAINKRNEYMINNSQYMICYVNNTFSNSYKYAKLASRKSLEVLNLGLTDINIINDKSLHR